MSKELKLPVFPLPEVIFFPRTLLPLHVFEPRYKQMISDLLNRPEEERLLIISNLQNKNLPKGSNPFSDIGTVGRLVHVEKLKNGRSNIVLYGQFTAKVREIEAEHNPYRMAEVLKIREEFWDQPLEDRTSQKERLLTSLREFMDRTNTMIKNLDNVDVDDLINGLAFSLTIDPKQKQELLETQNLDKRMELLIEILEQIGYYADYIPDKDEYLGIN